MLYLVRGDLKSQIQSLDSKVETGFLDVKSSLLQMQLLLEEQNANNRIVVEGLQGLERRFSR